MKEDYIRENIGKMSQRKLAKRAGCSFHKLRKFIEDNNLLNEKTNNRSAKGSETADFIRAHPHLTCKQIADKLHLKLSYIRHIVFYHDLDVVPMDNPRKKPMEVNGLFNVDAVGNWLTGYSESNGRFGF